MILIGSIYIKPEVIPTKMQYMVINAPKLVMKLKTRNASEMIIPPKNVINFMPIMSAIFIPKDSEENISIPIIGNTI